MDQKEFVRRNYIKLTEAIAPNVEAVVVWLFSNGVISRHMKDNVLESNKTQHKKTWALLDLIVTRGPRALDYLYNAVLEEQLYEAADILKPEKGPHMPVVVLHPYVSSPAVQQTPTMEYDSPDEGLPDTWPSEEAIKACTTVRMVKETHRRMINLFKETLTPRGQEMRYLMSAKPRGRVLVINNEEFTHLDNRVGSFEDRKSLETLFKALDFDVEVAKNQTKERMWELLVKESEKEYHKKAQCFVLVILSHGHTGVVFGTDGRLRNGHPENFLEIKNITDLFCKSENLQGKPKLFFIQACQGANKNEGHPVGQADSTVPQKSAAADGEVPISSFAASSAPVAGVGDTKEQEEIIKEAKATLQEVISTTQSDAAGDKRPSGADVFVAVATIPGFLSYRNTQIGTWFIQAISYVFAKYAYKYDLNKLMTWVNNLVGRAETGKERYKQICEKKDSFQKEFYFFPGLVDDK
ncbi:unnamed protein product [Candidula unifasciata]|uniref:Uncharacterized protein n=1 Tax=Candidula unifasciata TaxID=100452 RepID=A0A8S3ZDA0_9EUPU|nr:unnamed protein product [Candidula unifasciata]